MGRNLLQELINNERRTEYSGYTLDSITSLLEKLGNPHKKIRCIHIAGTNGKGSTAWFLWKIFKDAGYKTGLYTSPHLTRVNERIIIDDAPVDDSSLDKCLERIGEIMDKDISIVPTFFDVLTAAAFSWFSDSLVDIAIIETGLGGRKDSSNVIMPLCSILTDISFDHMAILGSSLPEIVQEKTGIIKKGVPVISSNNDLAVQEQIAGACSAVYADLYTFGREFHAVPCQADGSHVCFDYTFKSVDRKISLDAIVLQSPVQEQIKNASLAVTAALLLMPVFPRLQLLRIRESLSQTRVPGRFMVIQEEPLLLFDPAHNPAAMNSLIQTITKNYSGRRPIAVVTFMKDKDYESMLTLLNKNGFIVFYLAAPGADNRAFIPDNAADSRIRHICQSEEELLREILELPRENLMLLFTGSFRIYNTALSLSQKLISKP